jgi:uncharacterized protein
MTMLCHEHDDDPEFFPEPISRENHDDVIAHMAAWPLRALSLTSRRNRKPGRCRTSGLRRTAPKFGRNDPCPCGSGKKYKRCCGGATVN